MSEITITIEPGARVVRVAPGTRALDAARRAGLPLMAECGGLGKCGKCRVAFTRGEPPASDEDSRHLSIGEIDSGMRLACRAVLHQDAAFMVPPELLLPNTSMKKEKSVEAIAVAPDPAVRRVRVSMDMPRAEDSRSDARRLLDSLQCKASAPSLPVLRTLPSVLRDNDFDVNVVLHEESGRTQILDVRPCEDNSLMLGAALDIGTTTLGVRIMDLLSGECLAYASSPNPQAAWGADVISRIQYAAESKNSLITLRHSVVGAANQILGTALESINQSRETILEVCLCGNPAMAQIFLGINPQPIGATPFAPAANSMLTLSAIDAGLGCHARARLFTLPCVAGYVGADAVGALVAANPAQKDLPALILDFGTNAEIILVCEDRIFACAAAAGPALEGAHLCCGMGAWPGAVDRVDVTENGVQFTTIGDVEPSGLCGTGALDCLAGLLNAGVVESSGRFSAPVTWPVALQPHAAVDHAGRPAFRVVKSAGLGSGVLFTQGDVRQLQLARGAISAGAQVLLKAAGIGAQDLHAVLAAGALGTFLRPETARTTGLAPHVPMERIRFIGNAALAGAARALASRAERERARILAERITYIELSGRADFNSAFEASLVFD